MIDLLGACPIPDGPFKGLPMGQARGILADPAWLQEFWSREGINKAPQAKYDCMSLDDIKALPVRDLCAPDCLLMMWALPNMIPEALEVVGAWGFRFTTMGVWHKKTVHGKTHFSTGYVLRGAMEPFIIAKIGEPKTVSKSIRNIFEARVREYSRKPDQQYEIMEALIPYVELFSRTNREGWTSWGNQSGKFGEVA